MRPASEALVAFTITMTRIAHLLPGGSNSTFPSKSFAPCGSRFADHLEVLGRDIGGLSHGVNREHIGGAQAGRAAKRPLDRILQRGYLDQVEAADQFLGFHKGTVENGALSLRYANAYTFAARIQPFRGYEHPGPVHFFVEPHVRGEGLVVRGPVGRWRLRIRGGCDEKSHVRSPVVAPARRKPRGHRCRSRPDTTNDCRSDRHPARLFWVAIDAWPSVTSPGTADRSAVTVILGSEKVRPTSSGSARRRDRS